MKKKEINEKIVILRRELLFCVFIRRLEYDLIGLSKYLIRPS